MPAPRLSRTCLGLSKFYIRTYSAVGSFIFTSEAEFSIDNGFYNSNAIPHLAYLGYEKD
jgi:hypothetical protein